MREQDKYLEVGKLHMVTDQYFLVYQTIADALFAKDTAMKSPDAIDRIPVFSSVSIKTPEAETVIINALTDWMHFGRLTCAKTLLPFQIFMMLKPYKQNARDSVREHFKLGPDCHSFGYTLYQILLEGETGCIWVHQMLLSQGTFKRVL